MCVTMLIGTTFAWFTDTTSTAVNKVQAGILDVALEMKDAEGNWVNAEGKTLNFKATDGRDDILWEPGCTYDLPELRIVNKGNLALKYQIIITGINGDAKLNDAITWTITTPVGDWDTMTGTMSSGINSWDGKPILSGVSTEDSPIIKISGHMKKMPVMNIRVFLLMVSLSLLQLPSILMKKTLIVISMMQMLNTTQRL